mmetsp:Transcript_31100/g.103602  ORF Transcript_31100/g.103602 Transcript_31100/m.103602 type:complete len:169 (-) Transcript_31100:30-536(-)
MRRPAIHSTEGEGTKMLVFMQWDAIAAQLERALRFVGVPPLVLRGPLVQRQKVLARFTESQDVEASVLLLSLEHSPAGMNLVCAHHVFLVHPMHAETPEEAAACEAQAIGRARRQGQQQTVHVHRFVALGTAEEALARPGRVAAAQVAAKAAAMAAPLGRERERGPSG